MDRARGARRVDLTAAPAAWVPSFDPPSPPRSSTRLARITAVGAALVALTALVALRQPNFRAWETVWAEDGLVFAHDANAGPALLTLLKGYAGYANLAPRLLALPTAVLPVEQFAGALAGASAAFTVGLALLVYRFTAGVLRSAWLRGLLVVMTALLPVLYLEANASVANVNWTLLFASFWAVMAVTDRRSDIVLRAGLVFVAIVSTPLIVLHLPLAALMAAGRRTGAQVTVLVALVAGGIVQLAASLATTDTTPPGVSRLADLPPIFGTRVAGTLLVGERPLDALWSDHGVAVAIIGGALLVFVLALLAWRAERDARLFAVCAVSEAVLVFAVPILTRGSKVMRLADDVYNVNGSRYLIAPVLILFSAVLVLVDRQRSTMRAPARRWLQGLVIAHSLALVVTSYALEGKRSQGPAWEPTVRAAQETCRSGAEEASFMLISPGLYMQLDCDRIGTS